MNRLPALLVVFLVSTTVARCQKTRTPQEIYVAARYAVVQISSDGHFRGNGFIVSSDGTIVTANHVITTSESHFKTYLSDLAVDVVASNGVKKTYPATPTNAEVSDDQVIHDSATLKIDAPGLTHVTMGSWDEIDIGAPITIVSSFEGLGILLLEGHVAAKNAFPVREIGTDHAINAILFQSPVRRGMSGSPVFGPSGRVVGVVDTKIFGISVTLDDLRNQWLATVGHGTAKLFGIDLSQSFLQIINDLDSDLISGLGSAVAIDYSTVGKN